MALARLSGVTLTASPTRTSRRIPAVSSQSLGNPYRRVGVDRDGTTAINFGVYGVPETYVVDGTGHIRYRHVGPLSEQDVDRTVLPLIARITDMGRQRTAQE